LPNTNDMNTTTLTNVPSGVLPPSDPKSLNEAGLSLDLILQLVLKTLHFAGELTGADLARRVGLAFPVLEPAVEMLKQHHHCEIVGGSMVGASSYKYRITDAGRARAVLFLENNHYVGVAPVPLAQYRDYMNRFDKAVRGSVTRDAVRRAFAHLVLTDKVIDQLGPAINAGHSMFVYGPPGNGKSVISQAIRNLLVGEIAIPHALEVEGSIIRFFDPVNHEVLPEVSDEASLDLGVRFDSRWVRCRRPLVMVGGELTLDALSLHYTPSAGFYQAPVQAVANGGVLVIDDFGRQQCAPRDLLNRWIVPLENRVDFLTLQTGQKFELPFMTMVVFATNIKPADLVDEAFLRRIHYKIFAESPSIEDFLKIFDNCCRDRGLEFDRRLVQRLLVEYYRPRKIALRGCHPRDLVDHVLSRAEYLDERKQLTYDALEAACASYFVDDTEIPAVYA
jgi:predicted ATPase with chaperone activity